MTITPEPLEGFPSRSESVESVPEPPEEVPDPTHEPLLGEWPPEDTRIIECPDAGLEPKPWACMNPYCFHKDRWWMSRYGVVNCRNCVPPAFPWLVVASGTAAEAPIVEARRSRQAVSFPPESPTTNPGA